MKFQTQTGGQSLTAQQPLNNIVRVTIQTLASVLGGTRSLHTNSYDEALVLHREKAVRIAIRTQQIIAEESGTADIVDPMGGSFAIEKLTNEMEDEIMVYIGKIKEMGGGSVRDGVLASIEDSYFDREIQDSAYEYQQLIERGEEVVVGINEYTSKKTPNPTYCTSTAKSATGKSSGSNRSKPSATTRKSNNVWTNSRRLSRLTRT